jgi:hypothetical protein
MKGQNKILNKKVQLTGFECMVRIFSVEPVHVPVYSYSQSYLENSVISNIELISAVSQGFV